MAGRPDHAPARWRTALDAFQRRHRPVALAVAVLRKFGDDRAGRQAALIAYFGFFSLFPLLLAATTIVGFVLSDAEAAELESSILAELPIFGSQIETGSLQGSVPALVIGLVLAILAGLRCMLAAQEAMNAVWDVPRYAEPGSVAKRLRSLGVLAAMGLVLVASTAASQAIPVLPDVPGVARAGGVALSLLVNLALFMVAFQLLTIGHQSWRNLVPGALFGALGYGVLQEVGRWYVERTITGASDTYGTFAVVIGLLSWLFLIAQLFVLAAEINVVVARHLWPRSLLHDQLTEADERALVAAALERQRYEHQRIEVTFDAEPEQRPPRLGMMSPEVPAPVEPSVEPSVGPPVEPPADPHEALLARIADRSAKVVVVGQGYVGLPVAMRASQVGFAVVGYEASAERVKALAAGESYVGDVSNAELAAALAAGYHPTCDPADLAGFDVAVISVPTPLREGLPDLSYIEAAGRDLAAQLRPGACVILESTTYPGTTEELLAPLLEAGSGLAAGQYALGYSPERIDPGNTRYGLVNTPKVVSGVDDVSLRAVDAFFSALVDTTVPVGSPAEAELVKLLENTFRHVNIALVNELAMFARELGVDIWRAIDAAATKPFGFMRFTPGPGVGGHCLPIDPSYLAWRVKRHLGHTFRFVELANDINEHMPDYVHERITAMLNRDRLAVNGSRILLLGLAYKAGTSDWRESPSVPVAERLAASGADVRFCDPYIAEVNAHHVRFPLVPFTPAELADADLVVVLVDHPEFSPATIATHARRVFDTKNLLRHETFTGEVL